MDQTFIELFAQDGNADIRFVDPKTGEVDFKSKDGVKKYFLKPLHELYGEGRGFASVDPQNDVYHPLLLCIERSILDQYRHDENLTDGLVALTLDRMAVNPSCDPLSDVLCMAIQFDLRLELSLKNYSRQEVKQACRVISKSVQRHSKAAGITGYLEFISRQLRDM